MPDLKFALIGAGFWAKYQLAAWGEVAGVRCVAVCDQSLEKAQHLAEAASIANASNTLSRLLQEQSLDFVDIVTDVASHAELAHLALQHGVAAICQKPLTDNLASARALCRWSHECRRPLLVHENWRWQAPIRRLKTILDSDQLGSLVRARIDYAHSFPIFDFQPALKLLDRFILADMGTHILDVSRFLFGEAEQLHCQTRQMRADIVGEDVATVLIRKVSGLTVTCNMSYASRWELDRFPQTMIAVEGTRGGVSLGSDYCITMYDAQGSHCEKVAIPQYPWANPQFELVHSSIVACHRNMLYGLRGETGTETTCDDNLRTLELVEAAYTSAATASNLRISSAC